MVIILYLCFNRFRGGYTITGVEIGVLVIACIVTIIMIIERTCQDDELRQYEETARQQEIINYQIATKEREQLLRDLQYYQARLDRLLDLQESIESEFQAAYGNKDNQRLLSRMITLDNQIHTTEVKLDKINERLGI